MGIFEKAVFMKSGPLFLCALCLLIPLSISEAADPGFEASLGAYSSYIWRGFKLSDDALQIQPSTTFSINGFSANIWANYDSDAEKCLEVDYTVSYARDFNRFNLELGYIHYDIRAGLDSDELYMSTKYDSLLNPTITVYMDVNEGKGAFIVAGVNYPFKMNSRATMEFGASASAVVNNGYVATNNRGEEFTGLFNCDLSAAASISLGERFSLEPMVGYTFSLSDDASYAIKNGSIEEDDAFFFAGLSVTASF